MNKILSIFIFALAWFSGCSQQRVHYPEELTRLHANVLDDILDQTSGLDNAEKILSDMNEGGFWNDIDYSSIQRGAWEPANHLSRLLLLAKAYKTKGTSQYRKMNVSVRIHSALDYWLENDFQCPNWWYPDIGVPRLLAPIMLLMEEELTEGQKLKGIKILDRSEISKTGQNKVWLSGNVLLKSLLLRHVDTVRMAAASIQEELVVTKGEGLQHDWSYHQHGPQLQFGNYGLSYASDMMKWIAILRGTPFHFDEAKVSLIRNYLLEGLQWVTWKNRMDISACGRQLFIDSPEQKGRSVNSYIQKMETIDPEFVASYRKASEYQNLSGNRHFWRSDFQVHRTPEFYFSVKMCSERVIGAESCNSENVQGYYMGDGVTFLYQTGREFENIFPFLNWKKIPGTTVHQDKEPLPALTCSGYRIESSFVGGVSDGDNGIAVMKYNRNGLTANKSWFMFDDMIICLGSGISSSKSFPVATSVNQALLNGETIIKSASGESKAGDAEILDNPKWILHDSWGYYFPEGGHLRLETKSVEGSWHRVAHRYPDEKMNAKLFNLWFEHGTNPKGKAYSYILVPKATIQVLQEMENRFSYQIKNNKNSQEVSSANGTFAGIVFYEPGKSSVFGGFEVDNPCLAMIKRTEEGIKISVADPSQKSALVQLKINGHYEGENTEHVSGTTFVNVRLPQNEEAGKTSTVFLKYSINTGAWGAEGRK